MFQRDYWSMSDEELDRRATKYHIPPITLAVPGDLGTFYVDRPRIIPQLVARDAALQSNWSFGLAVLSLVISIIAIVISFAA
jgi:hypothetical protein